MFPYLSNSLGEVCLIAAGSITGYCSTSVRNVGTKIYFHKSFGKETLSLNMWCEGVKSGTDTDEFGAMHEGLSMRTEPTTESKSERSAGKWDQPEPG